MLKIINALQKIIAPPFCAYCREYETEYAPLCSRCETHIKPIVATHISLGEYRMQVHAAAAYEDPLKTLILSKSWSDYAAATKIGELLYKHSPVKDVSYDYIVPIPLHRRRLAYRGFNQAEVIGQQYSFLSSLPLLACMERIKHGPFQTALLKAKRHSNVQNAFRLQPDFVGTLTGKRILLLDDVMTTGSTLYEAGKVLLSANPSHLEALVVCRAVV
jgi:ComF family protein